MAIYETTEDDRALMERIVLLLHDSGRDPEQCAGLLVALAVRFYVAIYPNAIAESLEKAIAQSGAATLLASLESPSAEVN